MLKNFRIGVRLGMGFGVILVMLVALSLVGIDSMKKMDTSAMHIVERNYARIKLVNHINESISAVYKSIANMLVMEDKALLDNEKKEIEAARKSYQDNLDELDKLEDHEEAKVIIADLKKAVEDAKDANNDIIKYSFAGKQAEARSLYLRVSEPQTHKIEEQVDKLVTFEDGRINIRYDEAKATYKESITIMLVVAGLALLLVVSLSYFLTKGITKPIEESVKLANRVADGDLTMLVTVKSKDEIGRLGDAINRMVENLKVTVGKVNQTASQVAASADQVSTSAQSISKGAQTQASAAEETSSSMEQMAASIQTVAMNTERLATNVDETSASINQMVASIEQVARNTDGMASSVSETSATIEQMTASVDKVAKDTEDLSASVEETSATIEQMMASIDQVAKNSDMLSSTVAETSATIEEMAVSIKQVSKNVGEADQLSQRAAKEAEAGGEAVELTMEGINRIASTMGMVTTVIGNLGRRSEEIGKIVEVIEEIADQTNLLALNAAIEAARAGEAGRGFAVVADEVRKLAERSVVATKEIGAVIKQVQTDTNQAVKSAELGAAETQDGIKLANKAGEALKRILDSVGATNRLMSEISNATEQQSSAAGQVLKAVENMNHATLQVTTAVKEQAMGSNQIRRAVDNMNTVTQQVATAMKEQSAGGRQIRVAVEDMNRITSQVSVAAREQASGSVQIIQAVDNMNTMTQQVAGATAEQKRGGELVVKAVENISDIARDNLSSVQELAKAAENMTFQAESLQQAISVFKTQDINVNCWDVLHCKEEFRFKCPAYQNTEKRCWLIDGTWCKGSLQGDAKSKLRNCMHCEAFKIMQGTQNLPAYTGRASMGSSAGRRA